MRFFGRFSKNAFFLVIAVFLLISVFAGRELTSRQLNRTVAVIPTPEHFISETSEAVSTPTTGLVMGESTGSLTFSSGNNPISDGGVLVLNAAQKPVVSMNSYNESGTGTFKLYRVGKNELLNYLVYKRVQNEDPTWGSSLEKVFKIDPTSLNLENSFEQQVYSTNYGQRGIDVTLPISGNGIWFLVAKVGESTTETMIVRSNLSAIVHKGDNTNIFWVQDSAYNTVPDATVELLNLENAITTLSQISTNQDGIATNGVNESLDVAVVTKNDDLTVIPVILSNLNFRRGNNRYSSYGFYQRYVGTNSFMFTDRFLYKPGDTVYYKAIIRSDDDADYQVQTKTVTIKVSGDKNISERTAIVSELGTVDGSYQLPKDTQAGYYGVVISDEKEESIASSYFQVAQFRKPDASVSITTDKMMYLPGETLVAEIAGTAFLGQPLRNQEVRYKVYENKTGIEGDYEHIKLVQATDWSGERQGLLKEGSIKFDRKGKAKIELPVANTSGYRQMWTIHIQYLDGSSTAATNAVQALIQPGDFVTESAGKTPRVLVGQETQIPMQLSKNFAEADVKNIDLTAELLVSPDGQAYTVEQAGLTAESDSRGFFSVAVKPKQKGSYRLDLETHDKKKNLIKGETDFYVSDQPESDAPVILFTIKTDKESYTIGDVAQVTVATQPQIRSSFVSVGRSYSRDYRVVTLADGKASFSVPIVEKYQPNVFLVLGSFLGDEWKEQQVEIPIITQDKQVTIKIAPSQSKFGPQETARFDITATNGLGQPVQTDLAFWIFDKALLELHGAYFTGIFENFWHNRFFQIPTNFSYQGIINSGAEGGGGCFVGETQVTMADSSTKRIDQVRTGDLVRTVTAEDSKSPVAARVMNTHRVIVGGYMILNSNLKLTPEHILFVNGRWQTASEVNIGDQLVSGDGNLETVSSIEWQRDKIDVYNLEIEKYHTYFANNIYVHNDKGDVRSIFKDTAYWNPHITTDESGKAQVSVVLPDNLTTWVAAAVSANTKTQVGEGQAEFVVTKDVVTRPILPAFLRVGDSIKLAALINNFTAEKEKFTVNATFSGGELKNAEQKTTVESEDMEELVWPMMVSKQQEKASFKVRTQGIDNSKLIDEVTEVLPVFDYGFLQINAVKSDGNTRIPLQLSAGSDPKRANFSLVVHSQRYPALAGMIEQLYEEIIRKYASRESLAAGITAASVIAQHGNELGITLTKNQLEKTVAQATAELFEKRNNEGIWTDQYNVIDPEFTRFAVEALLTAQQAGFAISGTSLEEVITYVALWQPQSWSDQVEQQYIFSLIPGRQFNRKKIDLHAGEDPGVRARGALANMRQGFMTPDEVKSVLLQNGLETPTQLSWKSTPEDRNSSGWWDISHPTSWAIRALQETSIEQNKIVKALDYLYRNQRGEYGRDNVELFLATLQYYQSTGQLTQTGRYQVLVGETLLADQALSLVRKQPKAYSITPEQIAAGAELRVEQTGAGTLFTKFTSKELIADRETTAQSNNLTLKRRYLSNKKPGEPTLPGDLVLVQFTVTGLGQGETAVEIDDYLPAGLVAIDESMLNDDFENNGDNSTYVSQQLTDQGMRLTFSQLFTDTGTYTYKTRVIAEGEYAAPPAMVRLTNEPSVWASSTPNQLIVDGKHALEVAESLENQPLSVQEKSGAVMPYLGYVITVVAVIVGIIGIIRRKQIAAWIESKRNRRPPISPPTMPPTPDIRPTPSVDNPPEPPIPVINAL